MRINLKVPYEEKDAAKTAGARWDAARKVWFVVDPEDLTPLMRWVDKPRALQSNRVKVMSKPGVSTKRTDFSLPDCGCAHVPPWEHCEHTEPALEGEELAHMRAISN